MANFYPPNPGGPMQQKAVTQAAPIYLADYYYPQIEATVAVTLRQTRAGQMVWRMTISRRCPLRYVDGLIYLKTGYDLLLHGFYS